MTLWHQLPEGPSLRGALPLVAARWLITYGGTGGSSSFGGAAATFDDVLNLTVASASVGSSIARARPYPGAWPRMEGDVMARVDFTSGNGDADGAILVGIGGPLSTDSWVALRCGGDGNLRLVDSTGADHTTDVAGPSSGERTGGNLFLRLTRTPVGVVGLWGVAAGADHFPLTWFPAGVVCDVDVLNASQGGAPMIAVYSTGGGVSGGVTVQVSGVGVFGRSLVALGGSVAIDSDGRAPVWTAED